MENKQIINKQIIRTAAYVRVSTKFEEQEGSYDIQVKYFRKKIKSDPNMKLVGIYGDYGKSGLRTKGRDGLAKLMKDCTAGKIDLILTKSISRFARNMADCVEMIRKLRALGVNILFEKENLNSADTKCDLVINILAAMAQEESHSISQNIIRAYQQYASEGRPLGNTPYGYFDRGDRSWQIREKEAKRIELAFEMASEGKKYQEIVFELNRMEERDGNDKRWTRERLAILLRNIVYKGDCFTHHRISIVPGKSVMNNGFRNRYYIEDHHQAIVSRELFDWVQLVIQRGLLVSNRKHTDEDIAFLTGREEYVSCHSMVI